MALNIFNIGKANERISALESELKTSKEESEKAIQAASENATEIEKAAESLKKERDDFQSRLTTEATAHAETKRILSEKEAALKTAQSEVAALPEKIQKAASAKALEITSAIGIAPIPSKPATDPAAPAKTELKGFARTQEMIALEIANKR